MSLLMIRSSIFWQICVLCDVVISLYSSRSMPVITCITFSSSLFRFQCKCKVCVLCLLQTDGEGKYLLGLFVYCGDNCLGQCIKYQEHYT